MANSRDESRATLLRYEQLKRESVGARGSEQVGGSTLRRDAEEILMGFISRHVAAGCTREEEVRERLNIIGVIGTKLQELQQELQKQQELQEQHALEADIDINSPTGHQKKKLEKQRELYDAVGENETSDQWRAFIEKRGLLASKWAGMEDSENKRLVWDVLTQQNIGNLDPICVAILVDNQLFIEKNLSKINKENCLNMACLFGSKQTAEYLRCQLNIVNYSHNDGRLFASMCLSLNIDWVREVFETQMHFEIPLSVDLYNLDESMQRIIIPSGEKPRFKKT